MNLTLTRLFQNQRATIGRLDLDKAFECFTLEDPNWKDKGPIACGLYKVIVDLSTRFKKLMPHILGPNVEDRGIRIHCGNTDADTEGCVLVGTEHDNFDVYHSRTAFDQFFTKLQHAIAQGEAVSLTVQES